jgi:cytochrome c oxidase subunit II
MGLYVIAQPAPAFRAWLADMAAPAPPPSGATERAGQRLFLANQCASCHQLRGTSAAGTVGPDLTHLATRSTLAATTIPNDPAHLRAWISKPQAIKPGDRMPDLGLPQTEVSEIASYLESLR